MKENKDKKQNSTTANDYAKSFYLALKEEMLNFAEALEKTKYDFFNEYSIFLKNEYNSDRKWEKPDSTWQMKKLETFLSFIWLTNGIGGYALLGKTEFDKLQIIKTFLLSCGYEEYINGRKTDDHFVVIDCEGKTKKDKTLRNYAEKYKNVHFVIFNNCENIITNEANLLLFKHLFGEIKEPKTNFYILLGDENKLEWLSEQYPKDHMIQTRIAVFKQLTYIVEIDKD